MNTILSYFSIRLIFYRYTLQAASTGKTRSDAQKAILFERRGALLHQVKKWRELQAIYMPGVLETNVSSLESSQMEKAETIKLWLPSQLEDADERTSICLPSLINSEKELRFGQLQDSLDDLRKARRVRRGLVLFHKVQIVGEGQKTQTKARAAIQALQDRIEKSVRRYRVARTALLRLDPGGDWENIYLDLNDADNRGPSKEQEEIGASDGTYTQSWIWRSSTTVVSQDEVNEDMRVEWVQCMARAVRWEEEVLLLQEEMRRVAEFLGWRSRGWFSRADARLDTVTPAIRAGISAYAKKQGSIFHHLAIRFTQRWHSTLLSLSLPHTWASQFLNEHGALLIHPGFPKTTLRPHPSGIPARDDPTVAADALPPQLNTEHGPKAVSDSEDSTESESGSDSSDSWVE